ncbi:hypothetical protein DPMN_008201 [Dreissena polymorpha]|uniref:Uncharacterized protein n=1 Tax=Dreissena polymorpha TaxID=45954 RepID=A0A9D4MXB3_DREPO|nr:hypothetical protein DPMN_008201 [Dreissena polymorpha]
MSKFHEDNVSSRLYTCFHFIHITKNCPTTYIHIANAKNVTSRVKKTPLAAIKICIFELVQDIIGINLLTKFHEDLAINVVSRVLTRFYYSHIRKNAPWQSCFSSKHIIKTNLLTKFHED